LAEAFALALAPALTLLMFTFTLTLPPPQHATGGVTGPQLWQPPPGGTGGETGGRGGRHPGQVAMALSAMNNIPKPAMAPANKAFIVPLIVRPRSNSSGNLQVAGLF